MEFQSLFCGGNTKTIFKMSSAKFAHRMVEVKIAID